MILDRIILENVGLYAGRQTLELTPRDPEHPIVLIGGLNGGGKTTLLECVHLGLYGRRAVVVQRGRRSYLELLKTLIHRGADPIEGACVEIHFRRLIEGRSHVINIARRWTLDKDGTVVETVEARRDGAIDHMLGEQWDEYIEGYLPARLAPLFFFDGEQVEELAHPEAAAALISLAVQTLLGLDLVDRLRDDLAVIARRKRIANRSATERAQLEALKEASDLSEAQVTAVGDELARNKNLRLQLEKDRGVLRERFAAEGGDLHLRLGEMEAERAKIAKAVTQCEGRIREIAEGAAPLLLIGKLLHATERQAEREATAGREKIVSEAETARDRVLLSRLRGKLTSDALQTVESILEETRPPVGADVRMVLGADPDFGERLRGLREHVLPRAQVDLEDATKEGRKIRRKLDDLDRQLARVPDADQLARIQHEIAKVEVELKDADTQMILLEDRHRQALFDSRTRASALAKALESVNAEQATAEHDRRILDRVPRVDETLRNFRVSVVAKHAGKLERLILESFQQLLRKPQLVTELRLNPEDFSISLLGGDRKPLPIDRLSAGERQLLATSILWGLAKASGRPVPTIIDTPLGRLDSSHRDHLVQRYFPVASHQVILLSTDEEIDESRRKQLEPATTSSFTLRYDANDQKTTIVPGYFQ